ncbi:MAG: hypothetical protein GY757_37865, partial [bacterium]|nr:hypothetical protein [bacterium]
LGRNHIIFPYHMSKATVIKLATDCGAGKVIWGEITAESETPSLLQVNAFILDLKNFSQKHLPLIKGDVKGLYKIEDELLNQICKQMMSPSVEINYPRFNLNYRNYEVFIKSLLLNDFSRKSDLLTKAFQEQKESDYLNFYLAVCSLESEEIEKAGSFLKRVGENLFFKHRTHFLGGLLNFYEGKHSSAVNRFLELSREGEYAFEAGSNLGVVYFYEGYYAGAEKYFRIALEQKREPGTYLNYIHFLLEREKGQEAARLLNEALYSYPEEDIFIDLFAWFLVHSGERERLNAVFSDYIPELELTGSLPDLDWEIKNPFVLLPAAVPFSAREFEKQIEDFKAGKETVSLKQLNEMLEQNPFVSEIYHLISEIYKKDEQIYKSEAYRMAGDFLKKRK